MGFKQDRREFIKSGILTTAAVVTGGAVNLLPTAAFAEEYPDVVIAHGRNPGAITRSAVENLGGMKRFVKPGNKVVIKPNMSFARKPQYAANTHPEVVAEVAKMCVEAGASRVSVLDNVLSTPNDCLALSQIPEYCKNVPNTSVNVVKGQRMFRTIKVTAGASIKSMEVVSEVLDADVLIAVPVGKQHSSSKVSLSMKGMMGLIFDRHTFHSRNLHESIVDMVTVLKPHLVVIDGTRILTSHGPGGGDLASVVPLNLVIASPDMVAADAQMTALGTFLWNGKKVEASDVGHIAIAAKRGLGRIDIDKLNIKNVNV